MKEIKLTNVDMKFKIDDEDEMIVCKHKWYLDKDDKRPQIRTWINSEKTKSKRPKRKDISTVLFGTNCRVMKFKDGDIYNYQKDNLILSYRKIKKPIYVSPEYVVNVDGLFNVIFNGQIIGKAYSVTDCLKIYRQHEIKVLGENARPDWEYQLELDHYTKSAINKKISEVLS